FGEHAAHLEHGLAGRRRRVQRLLMQVEVNTERMDLAEECHEMLQRAAKAIDAPSHDHVELAPGCGLEHAVEGGPLVAAPGTADAVVAVLLHYLPASALGHGQQLAALVLDALPVGRYAGVDGHALCPGHVSQRPLRCCTYGNQLLCHNRLFSA